MTPSRGQIVRSSSSSAWHLGQRSIGPADCRGKPGRRQARGPTRLCRTRSRAGPGCADHLPPTSRGR
jgi:hypothetical protein